MSNVPRIEGVPDPRNSSRINKESEIDPEKFKKVMKVDESDDAQKRHKRNRAEDEEVDEEEKSEDGSTPTPGFSDLMGETETRDSLFNSGPRSQTASAPDHEAPLGENSPYSSSSNVPDKGAGSPGLTFTRSSPSSASSSSSSSSDKDQKKEVKEKPAAPLPKQLKAKNSPPSAPALSPPPSPEKLTQAKEELKPIIDTSVAKEEEKEKEVSKQIQGLEPEKKRIETHAAPTDTNLVEIDKKRRRDQRAEIEHESQKRDQEKDEKKKKELEAEKNGAPVKEDVTTPFLEGPSFDATTPPSYSRLSSQVYELFERLVGLITLEQYSGNSKTTVTLNMPGSVFHQSQIVLEKFSTAPQTFNVQLLGSPQAVAIFEANMNDLVAAFQDSKRAFEVNIQRPYLLDKFRYQANRVRSTTGDDKQGGHQGRHR